MRTGQKTATSALVWELEAKGEKLPNVEDIAVVTNWKGDPSCIIEITKTEVRPFGEIDERFAFDYGEGDRTLKWWGRLCGTTIRKSAAKSVWNPRQTCRYHVKDFVCFTSKIERNGLSLTPRLGSQSKRAVSSYPCQHINNGCRWRV